MAGLVFSSTVRVWFHYAFYDWTRGMPRSKRLATWLAILMQGYAVAFAVSRPQLWQFMLRHNELVPYLGVFLLYLLADRVMHGLMTSEIIRKTQLEADQIAAQQIQKTLQPENLDPLAGYEMEVCYEPFRAVGGDYFDVIELSGDQTLFAVADVSGKGMPAALLAANIQALVRSLATINPDPLALANQINKHLNRYTPHNRFATAVFILLSRNSGEVTYVNAGHNSPIVFCDGSATSLDATGMPMGLLGTAQYESRTSIIPNGGILLLFTDGLTDSIAGSDPESRLRNSIRDSAAETLSNLKSLIDPKLKEDDVTILLVKRTRPEALLPV
ncbi:MAG TPA: PP2C family protein-serine/threonine phosphatase [Bryobacteraceae bacterium]|jgi:sigma-B regulation protein RsbU (phosphoserine phosphatase)